MLIKEVVNCKTGKSVKAEYVIEEANKNGNYRTNLKTKKTKHDIFKCPACESELCLFLCLKIKQVIILGISRGDSLNCEIRNLEKYLKAQEEINRLKCNGTNERKLHDRQFFQLKSVHNGLKM